MLTTEDIDRMKRDYIDDRVIEDALWRDLIKDIVKGIGNELRQVKRHIMDWLFIGVYFL